MTLAGMPTAVGLCPNEHRDEFFVPLAPGDPRICPQCFEPLVVYVPEREVQAQVDRARRETRTLVRASPGDGRVPCEEFQIGESVQAVKAGPVGEVILNHDGWTVARYKGGLGGTCSYKHGSDKLFRVRVMT